MVFQQGSSPAVANLDPLPWDSGRKFGSATGGGVVLPLGPSSFGAKGGGKSALTEVPPHLRRVCFRKARDGLCNDANCTLDHDENVIKEFQQFDKSRRSDGHRKGMKDSRISPSGSKEQKGRPHHGYGRQVRPISQPSFSNLRKAKRASGSPRRANSQANGSLRKGNRGSGSLRPQWAEKGQVIPASHQEP